MGQAERLYKIERLLRQRHSVPLRAFLDELEVSRATFYRDLAVLRDRLQATIDIDPERGAYCIREGGRLELPGMWFSSKEIHALLTFHHFLENLEPGLFGARLEPLKARIKTLLESKRDSVEEVTRRVRILPQAARRSESAHFEHVAHALLARHRLTFEYHGRSRGTVTARIVSPQRLVYYRDNWYLDAWDHERRGLRTFSIDRILHPLALSEAAKDIAESRLDRHFADGYGIFSGRPRRNAVLRFSPERARWVADERWHPKQRGRYEEGRYVLEIPYSDDRELVLDILRFGPDVEVIAPKSLRNKVAALLQTAAANYLRDSGSGLTR